MLKIRKYIENANFIKIADLRATRDNRSDERPKHPEPSPEQSEQNDDHGERLGTEHIRGVVAPEGAKNRQRRDHHIQSHRCANPRRAVLARPHRLEFRLESKNRMSIALRLSRRILQKAPRVVAQVLDNCATGN